MNLAPVEQYLAEYLSSLEESHSGVDSRLPLYSEGAAPVNVDDWPPFLTFPKNLLLIGTVNVDETARALSERVLDRANVIQLSVRVSRSHHEHRQRPAQPWYVPFPDWGDVCESIPSDIHHDLLVEIGDILQAVGIGIGQRSHLELERFIANSAGLLAPSISLDLGLLQRFVPKIRGFKRDLQPALTELSDILAEHECHRSARVVDLWLDERLSDDEYLDGTDTKIGLLG